MRFNQITKTFKKMIDFTLTLVKRWCNSVWMELLEVEALERYRAIPDSKINQDIEKAKVKKIVYQTQMENEHIEVIHHVVCLLDMSDCGSGFPCTNHRQDAMHLYNAHFSFTRALA